MEAALPPELPQSHKTLTAKCHCQSIHFTVTVPASSLPLPVHLCHCPTCRYTHGTLCIFHASLPRHVEPTFISPSSRSSATGYRSPSTSHPPKSERFFCSTCGAHFADVDLKPDAEGRREWRVATSLFDENGEDLFQIRSHAFTRSTHGGLYEWLPTLGERAVTVWNPREGDASFGPGPAERDRPEQEFDAGGNERLRAECHCGGVSFTLPRPTDPAVRAADETRACVSRLEKEKWTAGLDLCDDCRLVDGTHVVGWAFVPLDSLEPKVGKDLLVGTMKTYGSSPGVLRGFCGTCGATVFFWSEHRKLNGIVDVAAGLLRAPEGVLAERWLTWRTGRISYQDSGERYDPVFARSLKKGLAAWGVQKYGQNPDWKVE